jgi:hypothetical protein
MLQRFRLRSPYALTGYSVGILFAFVRLNHSDDKRTFVLTWPYAPFGSNQRRIAPEWSANLSLPDYGRVARDSGTIANVTMRTNRLHVKLVRSTAGFISTISTFPGQVIADW